MGIEDRENRINTGFQRLRSVKRYWHLIDLIVKIREQNHVFCSYFVPIQKNINFT